jgi:hypothetical protein
MTTTFKRNQPVRVLSFIGFERDWSQTAKIVRHDAGFADNHWYIVRFSTDGAQLCVHADRLMPANA